MADEWEAMFDVQYDLYEKVKLLIDEELRDLPPLVRSIAHLYVIEALAERARFNVQLPAFPWRASPETEPDQGVTL